MTNRYWVCLGENKECGPFPTYDEAVRERDFMINRGTLVAMMNPSIFKIRTDEFWEDRPPSVIPVKGKT